MKDINQHTLAVNSLSLLPSTLCLSCLTHQNLAMFPPILLHRWWFRLPTLSHCYKRLHSQGLLVLQRIFPIAFFLINFASKYEQCGFVVFVVAHHIDLFDQGVVNELRAPASHPSTMVLRTLGIIRNIRMTCDEAPIFSTGRLCMSTWAAGPVKIVMGRYPLMVFRAMFEPHFRTYAVGT
jgi:hypothetical protein